MALADFRVDGEAEPAVDPLVAVESQSVLAFDESLARTGWAHVESWARSAPVVFRVGMIETSPDSKASFADSLARAGAIRREARSVIELHEPTLVVYEMPAARQRQTRKREAAALTAAAVAWAAEDCGRPVRMLSAQKVKRRLTGNAEATKKQVREALYTLLPKLEETDLDYHNDDTYDAIALGVAAVCGVR